MTICKKCGSENTDNAKFCLECGANLVEQRKESEITKCIKCGAELPKKAKFCSECGASQIEVVEEKESIQISEPVIEEVYNPASTQTDSSEQLESKNTENDTKKLCSSCGAEVSPDDKFCPGCGMKLEDEKNAITSSKCISCGAEITQNIKFCPKCGAKQNSESTNISNVSIPTNKKELNVAMFEAIRENNINTVTALLDAGYKPNKRLDNITPLGFAAMFNTPQIAELLIQRGASIKGLLCSCGTDGYSPLMIGVINNSLETCKVLLESGADVGATNVRTATALSIAMSRNLTDMISLLEGFGAHKHSVKSVLLKGLMIGNVLGGTGAGFSAVAHASAAEDDEYLKENFIGVNFNS